MNVCSPLVVLSTLDLIGNCFLLIGMVYIVSTKSFFNFLLSSDFYICRHPTHFLPFLPGSVLYNNSIDTDFMFKRCVVIIILFLFVLYCSQPKRQEGT